MSWPILKLSPRIIVFRAFVDQLPKLDVAGSTPVARSLLSARKTGRLLVAPLRADAMGASTSRDHRPPLRSRASKAATSRRNVPTNRSAEKRSARAYRNARSDACSRASVMTVTIFFTASACVA
jgi:hypothetical protein